tara:strand:+ start:28578 stop:29765 length:1188 start_codon:yes stop_codon:yes gene_type:complete
MSLTKFGRVCCINLTFVFGLLGCQSVTYRQIEVNSILFDEGFAGVEQINIETEQDIFHLEEEAKAFVKKAVGKTGKPLEQIKSLVYALFDHADFNLLYDGNANTTANETFVSKAANCLSLSIMTYALAEEAGFNTQFQDVDIPEYWTRKQGFSMLNGHINLRLSPKFDSNVNQYSNKGFQVDFDPLSTRNHKKRFVAKKTVVAMYYNNKGADALVNERLNEAYAYFRAALITDDEFDSTAINLGLLYRLKGYLQQAEDSYNYALNLNPNNLTAWENLAYLYQTSDRLDKANRILAKVEEQRKTNPYYYINLGEQKLEADLYHEALSYFKQALSLDRESHEVYFGLAQVYFELGELDLTQHYLELARDYSFSLSDEKRYKSKLSFLSSLHHTASLN